MGQNSKRQRVAFDDKLRIKHQIARPNRPLSTDQSGRIKSTLLPLVKNNMVGTWFAKKCQHRLDWFHVARRIARIEKEFLYS